MSVHLWLYHTQPELLPQLATCLAQQGVPTVQPDRTRSSGSGIVVCNEITADLCRFIRECSGDGLHRVLVVVGDRSVLAERGSWRLLLAGAADVIVWNEMPDPLEVIMAHLKRWQTVEDILWSPLVQHHLVGQSRAWIAALRQIIEVARFTNASILLLGETGTGKEEVARLIHLLSQRSEQRELVVLDCTTIVPELSGSEFFGHERGAFTGAVTARDGAFALADGGTLFLDEIGELPPGLQAQLLRVIQEHTYKRVGSSTWHHTDFRLVCATNRDLQVEAECGHFRRDLYYRLAGWVCRLPPLRERMEDIIPLAQHFMQQIRPDQDVPALTAPVREYLLTRPYPGNVRDLKQLAARIMYRHVGSGPITIGTIPAEDYAELEYEELDWCNTQFEQVIRRALMLGANMREIRRVAEDTAVQIAIHDEQGNLQRAAQRLGVTDRALQLRQAARRSSAYPQAGAFAD